MILGVTLKPFVNMLHAKKGQTMKNYPNIEKSAFRKGEYVGYCEGKIYRISKTNSSFGTWFAHDCENYNDQIFAFGLESMSNKLQAKATS